jgi:hypothetical protein
MQEMKRLDYQHGDDGECFRFLWDSHPDSKTKLLSTLYEYAADAELGFTWYDAQVVAQRVDELDKSDSSSGGKGDPPPQK